MPVRRPRGAKNGVSFVSPLWFDDWALCGPEKAAQRRNPATDFLPRQLLRETGIRRERARAAESQMGSALAGVRALLPADLGRRRRCGPQARAARLRLRLGGLLGDLDL